MAKRLSEIQKGEIAKGFINGKNIDQLAEIYNCKNATIIRNLKVSLGNEKYKKLLKINSNDDKFGRVKKDKKELENNLNNEIKYESTSYDKNLETSHQDASFQENTTFMEIAPINCVIDSDLQKDLSSVTLDSIELPQMGYLIVNNKTELETKFLSDYPDWRFLPAEDLQRKTIEIYYDLKTAKRICGKDQKVIKIPNTNIFKIVSPHLISKGISRMISNEHLIALY